jgi:hypothetical protein
VAIQNAASVAALLITTEAMVAEVPKKNAGAGGMPHAAAEWAVWAVWISKANRLPLNNRKGQKPGLFPQSRARPKTRLGSMSVVGHLRTCNSALPSPAFTSTSDIRCLDRHVRLVPICEVSNWINGNRLGTDI